VIPFFSSLFRTRPFQFGGFFPLSRCPGTPSPPSRDLIFNSLHAFFQRVNLAPAPPVVHFSLLNNGRVSCFFYPLRPKCFRSSTAVLLVSNIPQFFLILCPTYEAYPTGSPFRFFPWFRIFFFGICRCLTSKNPSPATNACNFSYSSSPFPSECSRTLKISNAGHHFQIFY